ncbi:MAG: HAD-IIB family hydrolase, partial [Pseudomonadota bacterium]
MDYLPMYVMHIALGGCLKAPPIAFGVTEDTGGHITYILGLSEAVARDSRVRRTQIVTRLFNDPDLDPIHATPHERVDAKTEIVRLATRSAGYLTKEALAAEVDDFTKALLDHIAASPERPDIVHAHFADAGRAALAVKARFGIPVVFTAHSLGADKRAALIDGDAPVPTCLAARIAQENAVLAGADAIVASSRDEAERQLMAYPGAGPERIHRISPGASQPVAGAPEADARALLAPFLRHPDKPIILAIARPVAKKNLDGLIDLYGASPALRQAANLVILAGLRDDIETAPEEHRAVFASMLERIDAHDLYGSVAYPKRHDQAHVPALYRLAAKSGGVFVNPAFTEPFGLTLLEAASHGLPVVATAQGGPTDIIAEIGHGFLADPRDGPAFAKAIESLLTDRVTWDRASKNGKRSAARDGWTAYAKRYLDLCERLSGPAARPTPTRSAADILLVSDIDNTLTGCAKAAARFSRWHARRGGVRFAVATGRSLSEAQVVLARWGLPTPDTFITSVGSEIYHGDGRGRLTPDESFAAHIAKDWAPDAIEEVLRGLADTLSIRPQAGIEQRAFKRSYVVSDMAIRHTVEAALLEAGVPARVVASHGTLLDILPARAGKGAALAWCAEAYGIAPEACVAAGDSGNDIDMLSEAAAAVMVANRSSELRTLDRAPNV